MIIGVESACVGRPQATHEMKILAVTSVKRVVSLACIFNNLKSVRRFFTVIYKTTADSALTNSRESDGSGGYNSAISIANTAKSTADTSAATVANSAIFQVVANYAALPALNSVDNGKFYQVSDSTSIEANFSAITGEPSGFTGHSGLTVKLKSNTTASPKVWEWQEYYANDPETRYRKKLIVENLHTIDENYTIGTNNNAFSVGPVVVAANKTVIGP